MRTVERPADVDPDLQADAPGPAPPAARRPLPAVFRNWPVAGLLLALALIFMAPGLPPGRVAAPLDQLLIYPPWQTHYPDLQPYFRLGDVVCDQLPWRAWMQQELAAGRFPLWAPGPLGGLPLFANIQPGVLYPLHLLWVLLPVGAGLGLIMALKLWLAGLGMWGFLRALGLHPAAALLSSLGLMFSAWMVSWLPWQLTSVYLQLPWLAWAVYAWCRGGGRGWLVGLAGLTAFTIYAGHPEVLLMVGLTVGVWTLGLIAGSPPRQWGRQAGGLALAVSVGLALGAIQILPFLEALEQSHTALVRQPNRYGGAPSFLPPQHLFDLILPRYSSYPAEGVLGPTHSFIESNGYVGLVALAGLGLIVLAAVQRRLAWRRAGPWLAIGGLALLITYDKGMGGAIRSLPGLSESLNIRWVAVVAFTLLVVSAFGWDWLARRPLDPPVRRGRLRPAFGGAGLVLLIEGGLVLAIHAAGLIPQPVLQPINEVLREINDDYRRYWAVWAGGVALVVVGATALWAAGGRAHRLAPGLLGLVLIIDLWRLLLPVNGTAPADQYFPQTSFIRQLAVVPATERILPVGDVLPANSGLVYGFRDWRAQDALIPERAYQAQALIDPDMHKDRWAEYNGFIRSARLPVASLLGMRYFIFLVGPDVNYPVPPTPDQPAFKRLAYTEGLGLWEAEGVPGFTYLTDNVDPVPDGPAAASWLQQQTWADVRAYPAVVEAPPETIAAIQRDRAGASPGGTAVEVYTPGHIRIQATASRPALLVVAESNYPGWQATLDGRPAPILRTNYLSQGVIVPAGIHTVELRYQPDSFTFGAAISGLGLLGLLALSLWARRGMRDEE